MLCGTSLEPPPFKLLNSLHLYGTYEDWLMGKPRVSDMPEMLKRWESKAQVLYPDWPIHSAVQACDYDNKGYLPEYVCIGFFTASESRDPARCGSAMTIVWYQEQCPINGVTLPTIAEAVWRQSAKDYDD